MTLDRAIEILNRFAYRGWNDWQLAPRKGLKTRYVIPQDGGTWLHPTEARAAAQQLQTHHAKMAPNEARTP